MNGAHHVLFKDRTDAGNQLAEKLRSYTDTAALVLGLARGGVVVSRQVAALLHLSSDVLVIKKVSSPYNPEYALGALAPDGVDVIHWADAHRSGVDEEYIRGLEKELRSIVGSKMRLYRKGKKPLAVEGKTVILVDDGAATGATMEAAVQWARTKKARSIVVALPVASKTAIQQLRPKVTECVCMSETDDLESVGSYYESFEQINDEDVIP